MRIAINTRLLLPGRLDGIGWFTAETTQRIIREHPEHQFFMLFDRKPDQRFKYADNVKLVTLCPQARHPVLWYMFFEWSVTRWLKNNNIDLFVSTDGWLSLRTQVPTLTVIHDLNFEHAEDYLRRSHQRYMKHYFPLFAKKATRIATVSEFSKKDISETYSIDSKMIDVVYDGAHDSYQPLDEKQKLLVRHKYTQSHPYFIFIGTVSRRKNLSNILLAFDKFKDSSDSDIMMLVAGNVYQEDEQLKKVLNTMRHRDQVVFTGHVSAEELAQLLGAAYALTYTSLFEGFGIPIIEAFHAGTAVITSNVTSMPEVAGDATLIVDPYSVDDIATAMQQIDSNDNLRNELITRGYQRKDLFNWDRTAHLLWDSMMRTVEQSQ
ncbi:MAG: glycosyltransferase family 4 protein [Bacteroidales bacterium]|nr:glycosyltransferase family 4 protein [Bacteroidales bacterium]